MAGLQNTDEDTEVLQFNLTNPDQLTEQLDSANLNDDETDVLLREALKLNSQLKEVLRHQQLEEPSKGKGKGGHRYPAYGPKEPLAPRNPKPSSLPPITPKNETIRHSQKASSSHKKESKGHNPSDGHRVGSATKRKGSARKSTPQRPAWNDRFSFD